MCNEVIKEETVTKVDNRDGSWDIKATSKEQIEWCHKELLRKCPDINISDIIETNVSDASFRVFTPNGEKTLALYVHYI